MGYALRESRTNQVSASSRRIDRNHSHSRHNRTTGSRSSDGSRSGTRSFGGSRNGIRSFDGSRNAGSHSLHYRRNHSHSHRSHHRGSSCRHPNSARGNHYHSRCSHSPTGSRSFDGSIHAGSRSPTDNRRTDGSRTDSHRIAGNRRFVGNRSCFDRNYNSRSNVAEPCWPKLAQRQRNRRAARTPLPPQIVQPCSGMSLAPYILLIGRACLARM